MNCLICREAELVGGQTSVHFERNEMKYVIHHVPAQVCPRCNEAYVNENVAETLLRMADEIFASGVIESITEYTIPT